MRQRLTIDWTHSAVDLALALDAALIVVVLDKLGAVHQARTILALARLHRLRVAALILNAGSEPDETSGQNSSSANSTNKFASLLC